MCFFKKNCPFYRDLRKFTVINACLRMVEAKHAHLRTCSQALSWYAVGRIQQQELDRPTHRIWDEHTLSLSVHDDICVCWKLLVYRKFVRSPYSCICNRQMWIWLVVRSSFQCRSPENTVPGTRKQVRRTSLKIKNWNHDDRLVHNPFIRQ